MGRFTSPDEPFSDQSESDPQSWNLYSYVRNNPLRFSDPTGRTCGVGPTGEDININDGLPQCDEVRTTPPQEETVHAFPQLDPLVAQALRSAGFRAERDIKTFAVTSAAAGTAVGAGLVLSTPATLTQLGVSSGPILVGLTKAERLILQELEAAGNAVLVIPRATGKTADFLVNGIRTELKTLTRAGANTLKNAIETAVKQGERVLVDARNVNLSSHNALQEIQRAQGNVGGLQGRVTVLTKDGDVPPEYGPVEVRGLRV